MQYKIPQNVGIEDKIVGPLTLRQLIIIAVGSAISYVFFAILSKVYELNILEYIIVALPALLAVAFALIKINDIPLTKYIFLFLEFAMKPKKRVWDHRGISAIVAPDLAEAPKEENVSSNSDIMSEKAKKAANLRELTRALDSGGFEHLGPVAHEDIDVTHDDDLVTQSYFGHKKGESETENMYWRTKDAHIKMLDMFAKLPVTELKKGTKETAMMQKEIEKVKEEVSAMKQVSKKQDSGIRNQNSVSTIKPKTAVPTKAKPVPKKPAVTMPKPPAQHVQATPANPDAISPQKKRRRRNRKGPQPIRTDSHVNTTVKNKPAEYVPKDIPQKTTKPETKTPKSNNNEGEFDLRELKKGEIEINLD